MDWLNTLIAFWWCISLVLMWGWYFALRRYSRLLDERKRLLNEEEADLEQFRDQLHFAEQQMWERHKKAKGLK